MRTGIDLGTTFSLIAHLDKSGTPTLLPDNRFRDVYATPSAVYVSNRNACVGHLVDDLLEQYPDLPVIRFFKRHFGEKKAIYFDENGNGWFPEALAALVLSKLKFDAESHTGHILSGSVITVPAHFNDLQRKAVINAAHLAEVPLLGLVEEPVAAALHYGVSKRTYDELLMVYDLGGGTFDVSILIVNKKGVYVLAKEGITDLGGKEIDELIAGILMDKYKESKGSALALNGLTALQLGRISEDIKIELSLPTRTFVKKHILLGQHAFTVTFYRKEFERLIKGFIDRTLDITMRCLDAAHLKEEDINALMLVGGSAMIPAVKERLTKVFSIPAERIFYHEPMKAVAFGATIHAHQLCGDADKYDIPPEYRGVTGYNLGIKTFNPQRGLTDIDCVIKKNTPLPVSVKRVYYTQSVHQSQIRLHFVQYSDKSSPPIAIGDLLIGPFSFPQINYPIEVSIDHLLDGTVRVEASDPRTGITLEHSFATSHDEKADLTLQKKLVQSMYINQM